MFSKEITYKLFWVPGWLTLFLTVVQKCGSIPLSRAIMKERLRRLGHVLGLKDDRLPRIVFFDQPFRAKRKVDRPRLGWEDVIKKI